MKKNGEEEEEEEETAPEQKSSRTQAELEAAVEKEYQKEQREGAHTHEKVPEEPEFVQQEKPRPVEQLESDEAAPAISSHPVTITQNTPIETPLSHPKKRKSIMEFLPVEEENNEVRTC